MLLKTEFTHDKKRKTAGNSTYPKVAVQWLNQALCFYQSFCLADSLASSEKNSVLRIAQLFIYRNRYKPFMKTTIYFIILSIIISCNSHEQCYDCYKNGFNAKQKESINKLHFLFQDFLNSNYTEKENNGNQLKEYCQDLIKYEGKIPHLKFDSKKQKQILENYSNSGLESEYRKFNYSEKHLSKLHFKNLEACLRYDYSDSLVFYYLEAYRIAGDLSPNVFGEYIIYKADNKELNRKMLKHLFIVEYFVPIIKNMQRNK